MNILDAGGYYEEGEGKVATIEIDEGADKATGRLDNAD